MTWLEFVVGCLATYRLSLLGSKEEGPAELAKHVRELAPEGWIRRGMHCQWCQSFWFGALTALFFAITDRLAWRDFIIYWLAFSAGAIVVNQRFTRS